MSSELEAVIARIKSARKKIGMNSISTNEAKDVTRPQNRPPEPPPADVGWTGPNVIAGTGGGEVINENERQATY